jgi:hypothetical protein
MIQVCKLLRFLEQPVGMGRIRRGDERQRAPEGVDDFLRVTKLGDNAVLTPTPSRWKLPLLQMRRESDENAMGATCR